MTANNDTQAQERPSSTVKLIGFSIYKAKPGILKKDDPVEAFYGASTIRVNDSGVVELLLDSAPYHSDAFATKKPKPGFGMLMLYGIRDSLDEMYFWRTKARELKAEFAYAEFEFRVGEIEVGLTDRNTLRSAPGRNRFLNVRRMKASLQTDILARFTDYANADGLDIKEEMRRVSQIANRPNYFDHLFQDDDDLAKLDIVVIPVADDPAIPGKMRQMAYVRPGAEIVSIVQGSTAATILLPDWMTDKDAAKKLQNAQPAMA